MVLAVVVAVLALSLPSVALTYFKLRRRDLGAILNASGWAVNRPMRFSMQLARRFTVCAKHSRVTLALAGLAVALVAAAVVMCALAPSPCGDSGAAVDNGSQKQEVK